MSREFIQRVDLVTKINKELQKHDVCKGHSIPLQSISQLREKDEVGCNWSVDYVRGGNKPGDSCLSIVKTIISDMKKKYNIE